MNKRSVNFFLNLFLLISSITASLFVFEITSRVCAAIKHPDNRYTILTYGFHRASAVFADKFTVYKQYPEGYYAFPANTAFTPKKGYGANKTVHINNLGLRGPHVDIAKKESVIRVVTLGGSSTFGMSVNDNETYSAQLQSILDNRFGAGRFEVINGGLVWFGAADISVLLKSLIIRLKPDIVTFYIAGNDAGYMMTKIQMKRKLGNILYNALTALDWLSQYSYLANWLKYQIQNRILADYWFSDSKPYAAEEIQSISDQINPIFRNKAGELKKICDSNGIYTVFITQLFSPAHDYRKNIDAIKEMNYPEYDQYLRNKMAVEGLDYVEVVNYVQHRFTDIIREISGGQLIDFIKLSNGNFDLLITYIHLTPEGHKLLAESIADEIHSRFGRRLKN